MAMKNSIWEPPAKAAKNSQMQRFIDYVNHAYQRSFKDYAELYQWSINDVEKFWQALWDFCALISSQPWQSILTNPHKMPGAKWFVGAKLNFAENLLIPALQKQRRQDLASNHPALVFSNEAGQRRVLTYEQLYLAVKKFAAALRQAGVTVNDRVAAFMPNLPETVIAMLATASIGAIWSACSPDFGEQGVLDRFSQIQPKILLTTDGYLYNGKVFDSLQKMRLLEAQLSSIQKVIVVPYVQKSPNIEDFNNAIFYADFLKQDAAELLFAQLPFDQPIFILYSSGTTGKPKCIVHGAGGVLLQHLKELYLHTDIQQQDVLFYFTTCGWMMWNWLVSGLATAATLVLYDGSPFYPKKSRLFDLLDQEKISVFGTSAKYLSAIEKFGLIPRQSHKLGSLRSILSTGSPLLPMNFAYVYQQIKPEVQLCSISGGTDIVSCFALGNPILAVYSGELQCRGLGLKVEIYNEQGKSVRGEKGELVCTAPFPVMPIYFWNDLDGKKYQAAYFEKFPGVWAHGDYAELTEHDGLIIYGRSDAVLNPGGVRIGTAEIYRQVETLTQITESLVIGQTWRDDVRIILFVKLQPDLTLTEQLKQQIKAVIRENASPHHVPAKIIQVPDIPKTLNGKIMELAVREVVHGREIKNKDALANPDVLNYFMNIPELQA
jgi:acetoacetyl-CoA synthetase